MKYTIVTFRCDSDAAEVALYENGLLCLSGDHYHDKIRDQIRGWMKCRQRYFPVKDELEFFEVTEDICDEVESHDDVAILPSCWPENAYARDSRIGRGWLVI